MMKLQDTANKVAGWGIQDWCAATSIARATFYTLPLKPRVVKLGRRTVVIESPEAYLTRIAEAQREAA
jgi:hypothetical protein